MMKRHKTDKTRYTIHVIREDEDLPLYHIYKGARFIDICTEDDDRIKELIAKGVKVYDFK